MSQRNTPRIAPWVLEEMATAPLEDKRLKERLTKLLSDLGDRPAASIPAACGGHKEMTAAYRFFDHPKVTYSKVLEQVRQVVQYYCVRWMIEVLFRTWKSGCRVEQRRFEPLDRLLPCLALYWIVAWRVLLLCRLGRSCPDRDCAVVFEPSEWQSVWRVTQSGPVPRQPPKLGVMVHLVAQLGGYVNRPNRADPPGAHTLWLGLQRMHDLAWAWNTFGPGANDKPEDV